MTLSDVQNLVAGPSEVINDASELFADSSAEYLLFVAAAAKLRNPRRNELRVLELLRSDIQLLLHV